MKKDYTIISELLGVSKHIEGQGIRILEIIKNITLLLKEISLEKNENIKQEKIKKLDSFLDIIVDDLQDQDLQRQKIERVLNILVESKKEINKNSNLKEVVGDITEELENKIAPSAKKIDEEGKLSNEDIEKLLREGF